MISQHNGRSSAASVGIVALLAAALITAAAGPPRYMRFAEARPILVELAGRLPADLNTLTESQLEAAWPAWIERHDRDVRVRLEQGDEDTIVNWLLFGTTFTDQPRALLGTVDGTSAAKQDVVLRKVSELVTARLNDLIDALTKPGTDERRLFARRFLEGKGLRFTTAAERQAVRQQLLDAVLRVVREQAQLDQQLDSTSGGDSIAEFVQRSRLFRTRGLSLDTSLLPNYAVEDSLSALRTRGIVKAGQVQRVAVVGPGLDFTDKDIGFDSYPQQTLQPFAVIDALRRTGLAPAAGDLEVVLFDISPRVIDHVTHARNRALTGEAYTLHLLLPRATVWAPEMREYWQEFGKQIGEPADVSAPKAVVEEAEVRALRASAAVVQQLSVSDLNIVTQRVDGEAFDLVIATNVFVYYDVLEQALALANIEAMLKPGAFLLANFAAPEVRALTIRPVETHTTVYGRAPDTSENLFDFMVWYKAHAN